MRWTRPPFDWPSLESLNLKKVSQCIFWNWGCLRGEPSFRTDFLLSSLPKLSTCYMNISRTNDIFYPRFRTCRRIRLIRFAIFKEEHQNVESENNSYEIKKYIFNEGIWLLSVYNFIMKINHNYLHMPLKNILLWNVYPKCNINNLFNLRFSSILTKYI